MMDDKTILFEKTPVPKAVMQLAVPTILSSLVMVIYNLADTYFVGMMNNPVQNAAVTLAAPVLLAFNAVNNLFGVGSSSMMSRALGRRDYESVRRSSAFGFYCALFFGLLFSVLCTVGLNPLLILLGADANTMDATAGYLKWTVLFGAAPAILNVVMAYMVRAEGSSLHASIGTMSGCLLNIILDPIFILVLGMGVPGAAIATLIGTASSSIYYIVFIIRKCKHVTIHLHDFTLGQGVATGVLAIGLPSGVSTLLNSISGIFENNLLVAHGDHYVAALSVAGRATMIIGMLQIGVAMGVQPIIAYSYGARNWKRMRETILKTSLVTVILGLALTLLCRGFSTTLVKAFLDNTTIIPLGVYVISIGTLSGPFIGLYQLCTTFLQSTEKPSYALFVSLLRQGVIFIPALYLLDSLYGFHGIVWAQPLATFIALGLALIFALHHYKKLRTLSEI